MNLSAINANLGFKGTQSLGKLPNDMEWACDNGVDGPYPRKKSTCERQPECDCFEKKKALAQEASTEDCNYSYTEDGRRETWL